VVNRREFLGGMLAVGVLVGGCAGEAEPAAPPDADVLAPLLAGEQAAVMALAGVAGATAIRDQDRRHAARLRAALTALGVASGGVPADDPPPAGRRKQQNVYDYVAALPRLADPDLRVLVMELLASEAEHLAALRLAMGQDPVPDAFAGFTPPVT
jgi:hypothetical protein